MQHAARPGNIIAYKHQWLYAKAYKPQHGSSPPARCKVTASHCHLWQSRQPHLHPYQHRPAWHCTHLAVPLPLGSLAHDVEAPATQCNIDTGSVNHASAGFSMCAKRKHCSTHAGSSGVARLQTGDQHRAGTTKARTRQHCTARMCDKSATRAAFGIAREHNGLYRRRPTQHSAH